MTEIWNEIEQNRRQLAKISPTQELYEPAKYFEAEALRMSLVILFNQLKQVN